MVKFCDDEQALLARFLPYIYTVTNGYGTYAEDLRQDALISVVQGNETYADYYLRYNFDTYIKSRIISTIRLNSLRYRAITGKRPSVMASVHSIPLKDNLEAIPTTNSEIVERMQNLIALVRSDTSIEQCRNSLVELVELYEEAKKFFDVHF